MELGALSRMRIDPKCQQCQASEILLVFQGNIFVIFPSTVQVNFLEALHIVFTSASSPHTNTTSNPSLDPAPFIPTKQLSL